LTIREDKACIKEGREKGKGGCRKMVKANISLQVFEVVGIKMLFSLICKIIYGSADNI
jgi:hypothetical protein